MTDIATPGQHPRESGTDESAVVRQTRARVRRPADLLLAVVASAALVVVVATIHALPVGSNELSSDILRGARAIPHWLTITFSLTSLIASFALVLLILASLLRHEPRDALNAGVAALTAAGAALTTTAIWHLERGVLDVVVLEHSNPSAFTYVCAYIAFLTASDLVRTPRWTRWCLVSAAALLVSDVAARVLAPLAVPIVLLAGLVVGWLVRWSLRAATVRPSSEQVAASLAMARIDVAQVHEAPADSGAQLTGRLSDGRAIEVRMANRDTRGSGVARRLWALIRLRPVVAGHPPLTSRANLERIALASYLAGVRRGLLAPRVLALLELEGRTLILATTRPAGRMPVEGAGPSDIVRLFAALRELHKSGVAHRDLRAENLLLTEDGAGFASLDAALPGASDLLLRLDVVQLLTTVAISAGPAAAVQGLRDAYGPVDDMAISSILQPIALAPWGWTRMRAARGCVGELRKELAGTNPELPEVRLERFRWRTVLSAAGITLAAFILVGQLSTVNLLGALRHANPIWFLVALGCSALTYLAAAENLRAFVPARLSIARGTAVQFATAFVGVAMPATVGHVAVNSRYLLREGIEEPSIAAAVTLSQAVNVLTTVLLLLIVGLLTGTGLSRLKIVPSTTALIVLGACAALLGLLLLIPRARAVIGRGVLPRLRSVWPSLLSALSQPMRLARGSGADLLLTIGYVVALYASVRAVGGHAALLPTAAVYVAGNAAGSAVPTPGGVGAVEAVMVAGLEAIGVPVHEAIPAVLIFRLCTFWLPIPIGWICFEILQRRAVL